MVGSLTAGGELGFFLGGEVQRPPEAPRPFRRSLGELLRLRERRL